MSKRVRPEIIIRCKNCGHSYSEDELDLKTKICIYCQELKENKTNVSKS